MTALYLAKAFRDGFIALLMGILTLVLCELSLRLVNPPIPGKIGRFDEHRFYVLVPNAHAWVVGEASQFVEINDIGYRDSHHATVRPPNVRRVAILGDSMTASMQVTLNQSFPKVAEREMARRVREPVTEILNFGVLGYSILQCLMTLREDVWQYDPQDIVLVLTSSEIFHSTRATYWAERPPYPFFEYRDDHLVPDAVTPPHMTNSANQRETQGDFVERSRLIYAWHLTYNRISSKLSGAGNGERANMVAHQYDALRPPATPEMKEAWHVAEGLLGMMSREVKQHGARFWIAIADSAAETNPSVEFRSQFDSQNRLPSPYYLETKTEEIARAHSIRVFRIALGMARSALETKTFYHFEPANGHWTVAGHEIVGKVFAHELCDRNEY